MREARLQLSMHLETFEEWMKAKFFLVPNDNSVNAEGQPRKYLAIVRCKNDILAREVYNVGSKGTFSFQQPAPKVPGKQRPIPSGWHYTVKGPIPGVTGPDHIVFLINRPKIDTRNIDAKALEPKLVSFKDVEDFSPKLVATPSQPPPSENKGVSEYEASSTPAPTNPEAAPISSENVASAAIIWALPRTTDAGPRRLVTLAHIIQFLESGAGKELQRYVIARDLREPDPPIPKLFQYLTKEQVDEMEAVLATLSKSQGQAARYSLWDTKHILCLLQGPPGCGKTTLVAAMVKICEIANKIPVTVVATSGSAADAAQAKIFEWCPDSTRLHHLEGEQNTIRRQEEATIAKANDPEAGEPKEVKAPTLTAEEITDSMNISKVVRDFQVFFDQLRESTDWHSTKTFREHYSTSGLNVRMLQNAHVIENLLEAFRRIGNDDPHAEFRDSLKAGKFIDSEEGRKRYKQLEEDCTIDTLRKTSCVVTTPSQTANPLLIKARKTVVGIHDEVCQASDLDSLMLWAHNVDTIARYIMIGDPLQLGVTVKTAGLEAGKDGWNPFSKQLQHVFFKRLKNRGFPVFLLNEQFRQAEGLVDLINEIFYKGKITNGPGTSLDERPRAKEAVKWIKDNYGVSDGIPHLCINIQNAVSIRGGRRFSKYNLYNIVVCTAVIRKMLAEGLFTQQQILVVSPYGEQCERYRSHFVKLGWLQIRVVTTGASQGREAPCVIYDLVVPKERDTEGIGFIKNQERLNVGLSRGQDCFILICDLSALEDTEKRGRYLEKLPKDKARDEDERRHKDEHKYLKKVFDYFEKKNVVYTIRDVKANADPTDPPLDWKDVEAHLAKKERLAKGKICSKCDEEGHRASECEACDNCRKPGHDVSKCPLEPQHYCRICKKRSSHSKAYCPDRLCENCNKYGHSKGVCPEIPCLNCGDKGHISKECLKPRKMLQKATSHNAVSTRR